MNIFQNLFQNRNQILEGIKNKLFRRNHVEEVAQKRLAICQVCPEYDPVGTNCFVPGTQPCCSNCGCSLALKTRSLAAECPLKKWPALLTDVEQLELEKQLRIQDNEPLSDPT